MKKEIIMSFGMLVLISCNGNQNQNSQNTVNADSTAETDQFQTSPFTIFDFPKHWYALDGGQDGSEYYINQWCESDTRQITLEQNENNAWTFTFNYGQEQTSWKLMNFQATSIIGDTENRVEGSFSLTPLADDTVVPDAVAFFWNRAEKYCDFKGEIIGDNRFVNEEEKGSYELVEEDCSGMWEE